MKTLKTLSIIALSALSFTACEDDNEENNVVTMPQAGVLSGGPYMFTVDGMPADLPTRFGH